MGRISIKGVILGIGTDIGGTILASAILLSIFAGSSLSTNISPEDFEQVMKQLMQRGEFLIASFVVGLVFTALGGYVAGRVAKKEIYLNSGLVGFFGLFMGLLNFGGDYPIWYNVGGLLLVVPAALYGGHFNLKDQSAR